MTRTKIEQHRREWRENVEIISRKFTQARFKDVPVGSYFLCAIDRRTVWQKVQWDDTLIYRADVSTGRIINTNNTMLCEIIPHVKIEIGA